MESSGTASYRPSGMMDATTFVKGMDRAEGRACSRQKTVAIVEDERDIIDVYVRLCTMKGFRVSFIAYDGSEALEAFKKTELPDVILIDHRMPNLTGLEAMKIMLDMEPRAKFIVLSADEDIKNKALDSGARAFMKKPASLTDIYNNMMSVLREP